MMYPIVVRWEEKGPLVNHLEACGIETREMLPLTNQPAYREWCNEADYPVARWVNRSGFYIGSHQHLSQADIDYIGAAFDEFFRPAPALAHHLDIVAAD